MMREESVVVINCPIFNIGWLTGIPAFACIILIGAKLIIPLLAIALLVSRLGPYGYRLEFDFAAENVCVWRRGFFEGSFVRRYEFEEIRRITTGRDTEGGRWTVDIFFTDGTSLPLDGSMSIAYRLHPHLGRHRFVNR